MRSDSSAAGARDPLPTAPSILIFATTWWPLAARLAVRLRDVGANVTALIPQHQPAQAVRGLSGVYPLRPFFVARAVDDAVEAVRPELVVPTDDTAVWLLHDLARRRPEYAALVEHSVGSREHSAALRSRRAFLAVVQLLGIPCSVPSLVGSAADIDAMIARSVFPVVLKYDGTSGGYGVVIAHDAEELRRGYRMLLRHRLPLRRVKRLLIDGDCTALYHPSTFPPDEITQQPYIPGVPANGLFVADRGEVIADLQVRVARALSATGAAVVVDRMEHPRMLEAARKIAARLRLSGFFGLDFILHTETGEPWLLEINPRATQLCHIPLEPTRSRFATLADAVCGLIGGAEQAHASAHVLVRERRQAVHGRFAFFPQSLTLNPEDPELASAVVDCPEEEPELVKELMRPTWPQRRPWLRLYNRVLGWIDRG